MAPAMGKDRGSTRRRGTRRPAVGVKTQESGGDGGRRGQAARAAAGLARPNPGDGGRRARLGKAASGRGGSVGVEGEGGPAVAVGSPQRADRRRRRRPGRRHEASSTRCQNAAPNPGGRGSGSGGRRRGQGQQTLGGAAPEEAGVQRQRRRVEPCWPGAGDNARLGGGQDSVDSGIEGCVRWGRERRKKRKSK